MIDTPTVRPGQVWADNDARSAGRTLRVDRVEIDHARSDGRGAAATVAACTILTNSADQQLLLDRRDPDSRARDMRGTEVRIRVDRMKPTSTGYRLIQEAADV